MNWQSFFLGWTSAWMVYTFFHYFRFKRESERMDRLFEIGEKIRREQQKLFFEIITDKGTYERFTGNYDKADN